MERRLVIVSNRLPCRFRRNEDGTVGLERSTGGLVSGLAPLHARPGNVWIGWADEGDEDLPDDDRAQFDRLLAEEGCIPLRLDDEDARGYYDGFSNSTLWPLFHGLPQFARFEEADWEAYRRVNGRFCEAVLSVARPGDTVWVHDYHLMLLPSLIRKASPGMSIGFFLHIPFPDYETFRMLPWRRELLLGTLSADLIGFHTYDYVRHFLSSCHRLLGCDNHLGYFLFEGRTTQADAFPLGIDYARFQSALEEPQTASEAARLDAEKERLGVKTMLSVERLDYTKGIPDLLRAFDEFLARNPAWRERVTLTLVAVPSRESVTSYRLLRHEVNELVGDVNGRYATSEWTPIDYYYRSIPFDTLAALYATSDVMLVTPLRDGMNLVCKEYLACRGDRGGVLVLSEMAGAAYELHEAILVNPFDRSAMADAMLRALEMPPGEQRRCTDVMQRRLQRYTADKWAQEFLKALDGVQEKQKQLNAHLLGPAIERRLVDAFVRAEKRLLLLDYDGTLVSFVDDPEDARPDSELMDLFARLGSDSRTTVAIVSGRDRETLEAWFGDMPLGLVAEHGLWRYSRSQEQWLLRDPMDGDWKDHVWQTLQDFVDRTPGSHLEEKDYSVAWHYRACSAELAERRVIEVKNALAATLAGTGLAVMEGNRVLEVKPANVDKGSAAHHWLRDSSYDFVLVAGDDVTDEDMFRVAPETAWTVKVRNEPTQARYALRNPGEMRQLLGRLAATGDTGAPLSQLQ